MNKMIGHKFGVKKSSVGFVGLKADNEIRSYAKRLVGSGFKAVAGLTVSASIFLGVANSVDLAEAYKEYGSTNVRQAISSAGEIELLQGVKVFGNLDSMKNLGITKEAMVSLDAKLSEYSSKTGNYVGVSLFGKGSGCNSVEDCKELNMKVKGLADGGVVILVMDTGGFKKNVSVVGDPAIRDFFSTADEKYVIDRILIPSLKSSTASEGISQAAEYVQGKIGSVSVADQRVQMAERAKLAAEQAKINEEKAKIEAELAKKEREEANKKMKELTLTTLKYLLMLAAAAAVGYGAHKGLQRVRIHFKKNSLFDDLDDLETTEKVFEMMVANGDLTDDDFDSVKRQINEARSVIQNLDFSSYANNSLVLGELNSLAKEMLDLKSDLDEEINKVNQNKKTIDSSLSEKIKSYSELLKENMTKLESVDNNGFSNIEQAKDDTKDEISDYVKEVESIKAKIASGAKLDYVTKQDFLVTVDKRMSDIVSSLASFSKYVDGLKKKANTHEANKARMDGYKSEDL